jgi:hypothetical protein
MKFEKWWSENQGKFNVSKDDALFVWRSAVSQCEISFIGFNSVIADAFSEAQDDGLSEDDTLGHIQDRMFRYVEEVFRELK